MSQLDDFLGFKPLGDRIGQAHANRQAAAKGILSFGARHLDVVSRGILRNDLVLIGGKTGSGKSELAWNIGFNAAVAGKRAHIFALEAEDAELENRQLYRLAATRYRTRGGQERLDYLSWLLGDFDELLKEDMEYAEKILQNTKNVFTYYRTGVFSLQDFRRIFNALNGKSDLVVVDHLHYFDLDGGMDENREIYSIVKEMADLVQIVKIPIVLVAHFRKRNSMDSSLVPDLEEFHGTSNITKVPTKVITMASGGREDDGERMITYTRFAKFRATGERASVIIKSYFDPRTNSYSPEFSLGRAVDTRDGEVYQALTEKPGWLR